MVSHSDKMAGGYAIACTFAVFNSMPCGRLQGIISRRIVAGDISWPFGHVMTPNSRCARRKYSSLWSAKKNSNSCMETYQTYRTRRMQTQHKFYYLQVAQMLEFPDT
jgi:hypothetical protein